MFDWFFLLGMPLSLDFVLPFHNLFLNQPNQRKKQGVHQHTIQACQLESVEQARKADAFFPTRDHAGIFQAKNFSYFPLLQSDSSSVFSQVIRSLIEFDFFHTLLD